jgi:hypothetical protein
MVELVSEQLIVRFEVFTAVTMKNAVFWDMELCRTCVNRRSSEEVFLAGPFLLAFPPISYMHSSSPPFVPHTPPISSSFTRTA